MARGWFLFTWLALALAAIQGPALAGDTLRVGTYRNYPPLTIMAGDGTLHGYEIDLANDLCRRMAVHCAISAVDWERVYDDLDAGTYDVYMGGMAATAARARRVAFTRPYTVAGAVFATLTGNSLTTAMFPVNRIDLDRMGPEDREAMAELVNALRGRRLGVHVGTTLDDFAQTHLKDVVEIVVYTDEQRQYEDLAEGKLDAVLAGSWALYAFVSGERGRAAGAALFGPRLSGGELGSGAGAAVRRDNRELLARLNGALAAAKADGTLARLSLTWFGYNIAPD